MFSTDGRRFGWWVEAAKRRARVRGARRSEIDVAWLFVSTNLAVPPSPPRGPATRAVTARVMVISIKGHASSAEPSSSKQIKDARLGRDNLARFVVHPAESKDWGARRLASAMQTRWRWPPDSFMRIARKGGKASAWSGPTRLRRSPRGSQRLRALGDTVDDGRVFRRLDRRWVWTGLRRSSALGKIMPNGGRRRSHIWASGRRIKSFAIIG